MGLIVLLVLVQLALCFAGGWRLAERGFLAALAPVPVLPVIVLLLGIAMAFGDGLGSESWARALPFLVIGVMILLLAGLVGAVAAFMFRK
jgi:hypothetical protein